MRFYSSLNFRNVKRFYCNYVSKIRNIGISAHIDSGKTTVTERILFYTGKVNSMHEVKGKDGVGAVMDFMELERQRGITIQSAATYTTWNDYVINIIDTPGHVDFTVEVERALRILDGAVLVLCAVGGVQSQTLTVNRQMSRYGVPRIAFINKLDRKGADHNRVLQQMREKLLYNAAFVQLPIGLESENKGIIDILTEKAVYFDEPLGLKIREEPIPSEMMDLVKEKKKELTECVANVDEEVGDLFLSEQHIPTETLKNAIRRATIKLQFTPVLMGTALKNRGIQKLLDAVTDYLPDPTEVKNYAFSGGEDDNEEAKKILLNSERTDQDQLLALAFKLELTKYGQLTYVRMYQGKLTKGDHLINVRTKRKVRIPRLVRMNAQNMDDISEAYAGDIVALFGVDCASGDTFTHLSHSKSTISMESMYIPEPVVSMSLTLKDNKRAESLIKGLRRFLKEDPTFKMTYNEEARQTILHGMGELHLDIYAQRLNREYNAPVELGKPKVAFRETLTEPIRFDYLHKKQSGGAGQFGQVKGIVEPLPPEKYTELEFVDETSGLNISKSYIPSINKGFRESCEKGGVAGERISGVRFRLQDGLQHCVDSSDWAFQCAARGAMRDVIEMGNWQVLEPIVYVEIISPYEFMGNMINAITKKQGVILNTDSHQGYCTVQGYIPLNNMFGFTGYIRSRSEGKAESTMEYSHYEIVKQETLDELIKQNEVENPEKEKLRSKK